MANRGTEAQRAVAAARESVTSRATTAAASSRASLTTDKANLGTLDSRIQSAMDAYKAAQSAATGLEGVDAALRHAEGLAQRAASQSLTSADRASIQGQWDEMTQALDRVVQDTKYGGVRLLDGSIGTASKSGGFDTGIVTGDGGTAKLTIEDLGSDALGLDNVDLSTPEGAAKAAASIKSAIGKLKAAQAATATFAGQSEHAVATAAAARTFGTTGEPSTSWRNTAQDAILAMQTSTAMSLHSASIQQAMSLMR